MVIPAPAGRRVLLPRRGPQPERLHRSGHRGRQAEGRYSLLSPPRTPTVPLPVRSPPGRIVYQLVHCIRSGARRRSLGDRSGKPLKVNPSTSIPEWFASRQSNRVNMRPVSDAERRSHRTRGVRNQMHVEVSFGLFADGAKEDSTYLISPGVSFSDADNMYHR